MTSSQTVNKAQCIGPGDEKRHKFKFPGKENGAVASNMPTVAFVAVNRY